MAPPVGLPCAKKRGKKEKGGEKKRKESVFYTNRFWWEQGRGVNQKGESP